MGEVQDAAVPAAFALNHVTTPYADFAELLAIAQDLGLGGIELRCDLGGVPLADGTPPSQLADEAAAAGIAILSVNALQRFDDWSAARAREAAVLAAMAQGAGARALVLCPVNDAADPRSPARKTAALREALDGLRPILQRHGLEGLVEPLGFATSALRLKREALDAIEAVGGDDTFFLLHDTFHHALSGEPELFPAQTRLVHVSGVTAPDVAFDRLQDAHRGLIWPDDRLGTLSQVQALRRGSYRGAISIEAFAPEVHDDPERLAALRRSLGHLAAAC